VFQDELLGLSSKMGVEFSFYMMSRVKLILILYKMTTIV